MPQVARTPKERLRSNTKPKSSPTQQKEASVVAEASADQRASSMTIPSSPESISGDEDSDGEDDLYNTDSLTSNTTASNATSANILSVKASSSIPLVFLRANSAQLCLISRKHPNLIMHLIVYSQKPQQNT